MKRRRARFGERSAHGRLQRGRIACMHRLERVAQRELQLAWTPVAVGTVEFTVDVITPVVPGVTPLPLPRRMLRRVSEVRMVQNVECIRAEFDELRSLILHA